ncbi:MAG: guanylate kinase [Bacteroidetes bacterium]|nr:MAG: guanylate kinase [Bacteroidota bacterium]
MKKGKLIVFSAPSGAGKTTLVKYLMGKIPALSFSVSAASRNARKGEVNGKDYHFLTVDEFRKNINQDAFVEWEEVYKDHFYGTLSSEVERIRNQGQHVVFDVDVKGGVNIKKIFGEDVLAVFIEPPSIDALKLRLENRATDSKKDIQTRIEKAKEELDFAPFFDVIIVNDDLDIAKKEVFEKVSEFIDG